MKITWVAVCTIFCMGCVQDPTAPHTSPPAESSGGVYILNEGRFGHGDASLSYYDLQSGQVSNDVFFAVNNRMLGDVGNSILIRGGRAYIVVNNSNRIEVIGVADNRSAGTIDMGAGRSPRQMAFVNDTLALVTNLYDNSVIVVNVRSMSQGTRIPVGPNPEGIVIAAGKVFVANSGLGSGRSLSVIDLPELSVVRTLRVGDNPYAIEAASDGTLYVLCAGSYMPDTPAKIFIVDPASETVVDSVFLGSHVFKFAVGIAGRVYVPVADSVVIVDTGTRRITGSLTRGVAYYGVGVDTVSGNVYLADPKNYVQPGTIHVYTPAGIQSTSFDVGIIPGSFAFKR